MGAMGSPLWSIGGLTTKPEIQTHYQAVAGEVWQPSHGGRFVAPTRTVAASEVLLTLAEKYPRDAGPQLGDERQDLLGHAITSQTFGILPCWPTQEPTWEQCYQNQIPKLFFQTKTLRFVLHRMSCSEHELLRIKSIHCYGRDSFEASQPAAAGIARPSAFAVEAASWLQLNIMRLSTAGERGGTHKLPTWLMRFPKNLNLLGHQKPSAAGISAEKTAIHCLLVKTPSIQKITSRALAWLGRLLPAARPCCGRTFKALERPGAGFIISSRISRLWTDSFSSGSIWRGNGKGRAGTGFWHQLGSKNTADGSGMVRPQT